jgi:hypothetical protein
MDLYSFYRDLSISRSGAFSRKRGSNSLGTFAIGRRLESRMQSEGCPLKCPIITPAGTAALCEFK